MDATKSETHLSVLKNCTRESPNLIVPWNPWRANARFCNFKKTKILVSNMQGVRMQHKTKERIDAIDSIVVEGAIKLKITQFHN